MSGNRSLQIVSDVHLEFYGKSKLPEIVKHGTDLALLGDIGKPFADSYKTFLEAQSRQFDNVFVLLGNHEYYSANKVVPQVLQQARDVCSEYSNVHLLERESFDITPTTTILGCTLWSLADDYTSRSLNDFSKIHTFDDRIRKPLTRGIYNDWHRADVRWLDAAIKEAEKKGKKVIVLTHHGPLPQMNGRFQGSPISSGFTSDLKHLFRSPVQAFANGHVHCNCDLTYNGIRCVSNAMGYPNETGVGYRENVTIDFS